MLSAFQFTVSSAFSVANTEVRSAPYGRTAITAFGGEKSFFAIVTSSRIHLLLLACGPATTSTVLHGRILSMIAVRSLRSEALSLLSVNGFVFGTE